MKWGGVGEDGGGRLRDRELLSNIINHENRKKVSSVSSFAITFHCCYIIFCMQPRLKLSSQYGHKQLRYHTLRGFCMKIYFHIPGATFSCLSRGYLTDYIRVKRFLIYAIKMVTKLFSSINSLLSHHMAARRHANIHRSIVKS